MAKGDELDLVLTDERLVDADFADLSECLGFERSPLPSDRRVFYNREIRHSYGHAFINVPKEWFDPGYREIVSAVARRFKARVAPGMTVEQIEDRILIEAVELARKRIIRLEGEAAWIRLERGVDEEVRKILTEGGMPSEAIEEFRKIRGAGLMAAALAGKFSGICLACLTNQLMFVMGRQFGWRAAISFARPAALRFTGLFFGPAGWLCTGALLAYDLGSSNWRKLIPATVLIISFRRRLQYGKMNFGIGV